VQHDEIGKAAKVVFLNLILPNALVSDSLTIQAHKDIRKTLTNWVAFDKKGQEKFSEHASTLYP